jgi:hypothetical protein
VITLKYEVLFSQGYKVVLYEARQFEIVGPNLPVIPAVVKVKLLKEYKSPVADTILLKPNPLIEPAPIAPNNGIC